jgi:hypothetical protein
VIFEETGGMSGIVGRGLLRLIALYSRAMFAPSPLPCPRLLSAAATDLAHIRNFSIIANGKSAAADDPACLPLQ